MRSRKELKSVPIIQASVPSSGLPSTKDVAKGARALLDQRGATSFITSWLSASSMSPCANTSRVPRLAEAIVITVLTRSWVRRSVSTTSPARAVKRRVPGARPNRALSDEGLAPVMNTLYFAAVVTWAARSADAQGSLK